MRAALRTFLRAAVLGAALGCLVPLSAWAQADAPQAPAKDAKAFEPIPGLDINELRRVIQVARDAGFSDEQIREITIETPQGRTVYAWAYLQAYERQRREEQARREAERNKVYLSPKDILAELDAKQPAELDRLRDEMLFTK